MYDADDNAMTLLRLTAEHLEAAVDRWIENTLPVVDIDAVEDEFDVYLTFSEDGTVKLRMFKVVDVATGSIAPAYKVR